MPTLSILLLLKLSSYLSYLILYIEDMVYEFCTSNTYLLIMDIYSLLKPMKKDQLLPVVSMNAIDGEGGTCSPNGIGLLPQQVSRHLSVGGATTDISNVTVGGIEGDIRTKRNATTIQKNGGTGDAEDGEDDVYEEGADEEEYEEEEEEEEEEDEEEDEEEEVNNQTDEEDLHHILNDLIRHEPQTLYATASQTMLASAPVKKEESLKLLKITDFNIFPNRKDNESDIIRNCISVCKNDDETQFHQKFKHVFILSSAGKPIYSLNGSDEVIMGYMGLITTIVSSFEEGRDKEEVKSVSYNEAKVVVMNKSPLVLVAITRIGYEKMISKPILGAAAEVLAEDEKSASESILLRQLNTLYNYLISMIPIPVLAKCFHKRMNYDLRKILTAVDFQNLDSLVMRITYGVQLLQDDTVPAPLPENASVVGTVRSDGNDSTDRAKVSDSDEISAGFGVFVSELLDSSLECVKLTNTTRTKLNNILLATKRLKLKTKQVETPFTVSPTAALSAAAAAVPFFNGTPPEVYVGDDLLFGLLLDRKSNIMSAMKPKNHNLKNEDLKILITTISNQQYLNTFENSTDLWIPICMPHFNSNGFLYAYVKTIIIAPKITTISESPALPTSMESSPSPGIPITILLLSSNKNSFFQMQEISKNIEARLSKPKLSSTLYQELSCTSISILADLKVPQIKHFIYKLKSFNQFVSSKIEDFQPVNTSIISSILQLVYFYSTLHNTRATPLNSTLSNGRKKRLTYIKYFGKNNENIVGFMLSSDSYEFYCLCNDNSLTTQQLISHSLKIIRWCEKSQKRLFIKNGAVF